MTEIRYQYQRCRENLIRWFWKKVPDSILYHAVIQAWANATCTKYTNQTPDEVTWSMVCKYLEKK